MNLRFPFHHFENTTKVANCFKTANKSQDRSSTDQGAKMIKIPQQAREPNLKVRGKEHIGCVATSGDNKRIRGVL